MLPKPLEISLMVTTVCQANCEHCCQGSWRKHNPGYHMSLVDLRNFIHYTKLSGYVYDLIIISGGEPLLWKYLVDGVDILHHSGITKKISIFTNGLALNNIEPPVFEKIYKNIDSLRITNLGINSNLVDEFKSWFEDWKKVYFIDYSEFIIIPSKPLNGVLPSDCGCPHFSYSHGYIHTCTLALDLIHRFPTPAPVARRVAGYPLVKNYLNDLIPHRTFDHSICQYCISNNKVRSQLKRVPNKMLGIRG